MARRLHRRIALRGLAVLGLGAVLAACVGSRLDTAYAGRTLVYEPGVPNFDLEAVATWRDGTPGVDVYLGMPHVSLVFVRAGDGYEARYERVVRLLERRGREVVREEVFQDTIRTARYEETQSYRPFVLHDRLAASPGAYVVEVTVIDLESDKQAVRRQAVELVAEDAAQPHVSRLRLEARRGGGGFEPLVSLHVPADIDSLRTLVELYNLDAHPAVEVTLHLVRYASDTTIAAPPYWISPPHGSLAYRGVDYGRADTLQVSRRRLVDVDREAVVEFDLPPLAPGIYRVELVARAAPAGGAGAVLLESTRDLSVKPPFFPHLELLDELIAALAHIAYPDEIAHIREAADPADRKRRFDAFWASLVPNRQVAANLIKLYYGRVEEANLYFTSFKEGWKTDRGMLYVVFGPPVYVDTQIDTEVWYYGYNDRDPARTFVFDRVPNYGAATPFENFILQRRPFYQHEWSQAVDRWRHGTVL